MAEPRRKSLAEELRDVAFAAPSKEDYLEGDLQGAPLYRAEPTDFPSDLPVGDTDLSQGRRLRGELRVEGDEYLGEGVSRDQILEPSDSDASLHRSISEGASDAEVSEEAAGSQPPGDLYEQYERLQQSDVGISELKQRTMKDRERGRTVQRDQHLWGQILEIRISLQKPLTASHQLPPEPYKASLLNTSPHLPPLCAAVLEAARGTLQDLVELEDLRLGTKRQKTTDATPVGISGDLGDLWNCLEERYSVLKGFSNETLDRFHRQAMLQSGATTGKGTLQRLHQGISTQVEALMLAPKKALNKASITVSEQPRVLAIPSTTQSLLDNTEEVNSEMFVDTELYQQLLNEHLLSQGLEVIPTIKLRKRSRHGESQKRMRAMFSVVQDKLINFMTPIEWDQPLFAKQLFQNLFSQ